MLNPQPKPRPRLLAKRAIKATVLTADRKEREKCHKRSGGRCEVVAYEDVYTGFIPTRCNRPVRENHHLISGIGRRNLGRSMLAAHRLDVCERCHQDITGKVLVPIDWTLREEAATVRYERVR